MVLATPSTTETVYQRIKSSAKSVTKADFYTLTFTAMSTACRINFQSHDHRLAQELQNEILHWISCFEAKYSRFIPDSLISRINDGAGERWIEIDPETEALFSLCQDMIFFTRGVFDPTALPLIRLWNWKANPPVIPSEELIRSAKELVGWRKVQRRKGGIFLPQKGMCLDLGGIGKEYAVDRVLSLALERGIENVLVDFGQDVRVHGRPPQRPAWHVGLDDPKNPGQCWFGLAINNHAVATSGDYLRHFKLGDRRYGHIIDPRDGYPVNNEVLSVSVIAPHCTFAGIVSTAAFVLGPKEGIELLRLCPGVEGALITESGCLHTKNFYTYAIS